VHADVDIMVDLCVHILSGMDIAGLVQTTRCVIFSLRYCLQKLESYSGNRLHFKGNMMGLVLSLLGQEVTGYESKLRT
jgi:hypothetical protein